jgi:predicted Zn-dependent protease
MPKKIEQHNKFHIYILIGIFLVTVLFLFQVLPKNKSTTESTQVKNNISITPSTKTYHSDFLEATINIPEGFNVTEEFGQVTLEKNSDKIIFHRIGTNKEYKNIDEFIDDSFNSDNMPKDIKKQQIVINGLNGIEVIVKYSKNPERNNKSFYLYKNGNSFYSFYTRSSSLYSDLDQIARSFKYNP